MMNRLISIELRKNKISRYIIGSICGCLFNLICFYVFAFSSNEEVLFNSYESLLKISSAVNIVFFMGLASVMYSQIIVEDYIGKKLLLLFTYPISRKKWMLAKISIVSIFSIVTALISEIIVWGIYFTIENFFPILNDNLNSKLFGEAAVIAISSIIIIEFGGIIALMIGMRFKSTSSTIISSIVVSSIIANIIIASIKSYIGYAIIVGVIVILGNILIYKILNQVDLMEI